MGLLRLLCPKGRASEVTAVRIDALVERGIRAILLDLDNTLLAWNSDQLADEIRDWVRGARASGLELCLVSNGRTHRVRRMAELLGLPAVTKARKPLAHGFLRALSMIGVKPEQAAILGDQIFTDVLGGNRIGLHTILIDPIGKNEFFTTQIARVLERFVIKILDKRGWLPPKQEVSET